LSSFIKLTEYKNNIIFKLIINENLIKALINHDSDFINQLLPDNFQPISLIYSQIFPYRFVPSIETEPKCFITMSFSNYKYINNIFKSGICSFYIICHKSLICTDIGLRYDYILDQIDTMFNNKKDVGSFNLILDNGGDLFINDNYFGSMISYKFTDFQ